MTTKKHAHKIIDTMPEDTSLNDIAYTLYVISKVEQGEQEIETGKGISHEEAVKMIQSWKR